MIFTMPALARSLADYLAPSLPDVSFYADPSQQGTASRALFLRQTNARLTKQMGGRFLRRLGLDLVYLEDFNTVDGDSRLQAAADVLDQRLDTFPYSSGGESRSCCGPTNAAGRLRTVRSTINSTFSSG